MKLYVQAAANIPDMWVIVNKEYDPRPEVNEMNQIYIGFYRDMDRRCWYPIWTSARRNNYHRAKLFKSKEEAQKYIDKQYKERHLFMDYELRDGKTVYFPIKYEIVPYADALAAL